MTRVGLRRSPARSGAGILLGLFFAFEQSAFASESSCLNIAGPIHSRNWQIQKPFVKPPESILNDPRALCDFSKRKLQAELKAQKLIANMTACNATHADTKRSFLAFIQDRLVEPSGDYQILSRTRCGTNRCRTGKIASQFTGEPKPTGESKH